MHDIILHIGANKTGSSAIQSLIQQNFHLLEEHGYVVPNSRLETSDHISGEHVFAIQQFFVRNDSDGLAATVGSLVEEHKGKTILLSGENMSNPGKHKFWKAAAEKFNIKIIFYIRRQDEYLISSWQQWYSKIERDFQAWLLLALRQHGHWKQIIGDWESIVGEENMLIRPFERDDFPDGNVCADFMQCLEIDPADERIEYPPRDVNASFSDIITPLVSGNKAIFKDSNDLDFYKMIRNTLDVNSTLVKNNSLLSKSQREKIIEFYSAQNDYVCRKFFKDRPKLFSNIDHSKYNYLEPNEILEEQLRFIMSLIYSMKKEG